MKTFICFWSHTTFCIPADETDVHNECDFSEQNGYDLDDTASIKALEVGQVWISPYHGINHTVRRLT